MFHQAEEDMMAWPLTDDVHFLFPLCHLSHFLLRPLTFPLASLPLPRLPLTAEATRLAVAGQTEPSQVFL